MVPFADEQCWHNRTSSAIIHTQNITFNKYPGQNIKGGSSHSAKADPIIYSAPHSLPAQWQIPGSHGALSEG